MAGKITYTGLTNDSEVCAQCGQTRKCAQHTYGFFNTVWLCSSGCLNQYARDNGLTVGSNFLIGKAW